MRLFGRHGNYTSLPDQVCYIVSFMNLHSLYVIYSVAYLLVLDARIL
uniref:G-protein coupled receptors family 1 profile domain-containing protein n=1 Tax=Ascaris lumbricoides TaxID=6252 RepID=A0A0M3HI46_ASCLU